VHYKDLYPLVSFLPRYANNADEDMLPLWHVSNDLAGHHNRRSECCLRARLADKLHHRPAECTPSLPASPVLLGSDTPQDDTSSQASWFRSLRKFSTPSRPSPRNSFDVEKRLHCFFCNPLLQDAKIIPKPSICDYIPLLRVFRWLFRIISKHENPHGDDAAWRKMKKLDIVESNVPLEILLVLSG
jgi:putative membrane protein